ncbi:MAG: hypothetical protein HQL66_11625 [Magnetococcales bacterium]|nr:hypothetical protein [Magnetococcales bacterium]
MPVVGAKQVVAPGTFPAEFEWGGVPAGGASFCPMMGQPMGGGAVVAPNAAVVAPNATPGAAKAVAPGQPGQLVPPCPVPPGVAEWEAPEAPKKVKPPKVKAAKAGAAKAGAAKAGVPTTPVANVQTVAMTGTKSAAGVGAVAKAGGTIWSGTGASLGLGLGLGAWGPVLLVGVASAIGLGTYYYMKKRHANAEELTEATS